MNADLILQECLTKTTRVVGIAADHGGYELKEYLSGMLRKAGAEVVDFGAGTLLPEDDFPDYVVPLARAVASGRVERGIAICGSGIGACVAANKVHGVRACVGHDSFSAHQGVEDDDLNLLCLGGLVVGHALAWELVRTFLCAQFSGKERHLRRLEKVRDLEKTPTHEFFITTAKMVDEPVDPIEDEPHNSSSLKVFFSPDTGDGDVWSIGEWENEGGGAGSPEDSKFYSTGAQSLHSERNCEYLEY